MAKAPIWMREDGYGNLPPDSPYAHDEERNTFALCILGRGENIEKLPTLASSSGGTILYNEDYPLDREAQEAIEAFENYVSGKTDPLSCYILCCVPVFAPFALLRRPSGALRITANKRAALLVSRKFTIFDMSIGFAFSNELLVDDFEVYESGCKFAMTMNRISPGSSKMSNAAADQDGGSQASNMLSPWALADDRSPFYYDTYSWPWSDYRAFNIFIPSGTPYLQDGVVHLPTSCTIHNLTYGSGFKDKHASGDHALFFERHGPDMPDWSWVSRRLWGTNDRNEDLTDQWEKAEQEFGGLIPPGKYYLDGVLSAICHESFRKTTNLGTLIVNSRGCGAGYGVSEEELERRQNAIHDFYGTGVTCDGKLVYTPLGDSYQRLMIAETVCQHDEPQIKLRVKLSGYGWEFLTDAQKQARRHRISLTNLTQSDYYGMGTFTLIDPDTEAVVATTTAGKGETVTFIISPFDYDSAFMKRKYKDFILQAPETFCIGSAIDFTGDNVTHVQFNGTMEEKVYDDVDWNVKDNPGY